MRKEGNQERSVPRKPGEECFDEGTTLSFVGCCLGVQRSHKKMTETRPLTSATWRSLMTLRTDLGGKKKTDLVLFSPPHWPGLDLRRRQMRIFPEKGSRDMGWWPGTWAKRVFQARLRTQLHLSLASSHSRLPLHKDTGFSWSVSLKPSLTKAPHLPKWPSLSPTSLPGIQLFWPPR